MPRIASFIMNVLVSFNVFERGQSWENQAGSHSCRMRLHLVINFEGAKIQSGIRLDGKDRAAIFSA